jgi:molybdopterin converting factor small subunit
LTVALGDRVSLLEEQRTMSVQVRVPTVLRKFTDGEKSVEGKGDSLAGLFADLDTRHPGLRGGVVDDDGSLRRFVNVYVNDEDVRFLGAVDTPLADGDVVTILPAVAGG